MEGCLQKLSQVEPWRPTDADVENCARICHEANRAVCAVNGDLSVPDWDQAPAWQKDSSRSGVRFHFENRHASDRDSHDQWMAVKLREGWRYGLVKDVEAKTHPCLLPYFALPESEKIKDSIFRNVCAGFAEACRSAHSGRRTIEHGEINERS